MKRRVSGESTIAASGDPRRGAPDRRASRRALLAALGIIATFVVIEGVGGYLTNSLALMADAGHLLTDVGALLLALGAIWLAGRPISERRTFGFHRMEVLAALANGVTLWGVAVYIGYQAYQRMIEPPEVNSLPMVLVAFVGFLAQVGTALVLVRSSRQSLNVQGAYIHVATDAVQSMGVIVAGLLLLFFGWFLADPISSMLIAVLIVYSGARIVRRASHILLEGAPSHVDVAALQRVMEAVPEVDRVHDLHTWTITSGYDAMSAHVVIRERTAADRAHEILSQLRRLAAQRFGIAHVTIQVERKDQECAEDHAPARERSERV